MTSSSVGQNRAPKTIDSRVGGSDSLERAQQEIPRHIGIILDGNRRWARAQGKPTFYGHKAGMENIKPVMDHAIRRGVKFMTVYAFSTENWQRSPEEVSYLMELFEDYARNKMAELDKEQIRIRVLGDITRFRPSLRQLLEEMVERTKDHTRFTFSMCLSYGGRDEILRAIKHLISVTPVSSLVENLTEEEFSQHLDSAGLPDPDIIIRTSGEQRLSGFLTWQSVYTELYFTPIPWPAFNAAELDKAIDWYQLRDRRYGK